MKVNNRVVKRNVPLKNKVHKLNKKIENSININEYDRVVAELSKYEKLYSDLEENYKLVVKANDKYFNGIQEVIKILKNDPEYEKIGSHEAKRKLIELVGVESL